MKLRRFREELDKMCKAGPPSNYQELWHKVHEMLNAIINDIYYTKLFYEDILMFDPFDEVS